MTKPVRELLKKAHDFGYKQNRFISAEKSFVLFMEENNLPLVSTEEVKRQRALKAQELIDEGYTLRDIASLLGYTHQESVRHLIKDYGGNYRKRTKKRKTDD